MIRCEQHVESRGAGLTAGPQEGLSLQLTAVGHRLRELEAWLDGELHPRSSYSCMWASRCCVMSLAERLQMGHLCRQAGSTLLKGSAAAIWLIV